MSNVYNKDYKFFKYNCDGIFTTGRIKRIRTRRESRYVNLAKRVGKRAYSFNSDFCSNLTRWNRH